MSRIKTIFNLILSGYILIASLAITITNANANANTAKQDIPVLNKVDSSSLLPEEANIIKKIYKYSNYSLKRTNIVKVNESDITPTIDGYMYVSREKPGATPFLEEIQTIAGIIINENNQIISLNISKPRATPSSDSISGLKHLKTLRIKGDITKAPILTNLPKLEVLDIGSSYLSQFPDITHLPNLRVLDLAFSEQIKTISKDNGLLPHLNLETLNLSDAEIKKLDLSLFPNLRKLLIFYNNLQEIDFSNTPFMEEVNLERCGIKNFDKFKGITQLKHMRKMTVGGRPVGNFPISNIASFKNITHLEAQILTQADLQAVTKFHKAKKLELLISKKVPLDNLNFLTDKKDLEELMISARINSTKGLHNLKKLRKITIWSEVNKFEDMHGLDSLEEIEISASIEDMSGLSSVTTPRKVKISGMKKLAGLENMKNLEILDLSSGGLTKIRGLDKGLKKLRELNLNNNRISKLEGLDNLTNLEKLTLENNKISKMEGLNKLKSLVLLDLSGNPIKKMEGLDKLTNLEHLFLKQTSIEILENYQNLTSLYGHLWNMKILNNPINHQAIDEVNKMALSEQAKAAGKRKRERDLRDDKIYKARHITAELAKAKRLKEEYIDWVKRGKQYRAKK